MKRFIISATILIIIAYEALSVQVDGNCYLSGQTNHAGTKVKFQAVSPTAVSDSTYSDTTGYFIVQNLTIGIYNVIYSHYGFYNYELDNRMFIWDTTLAEVTLQTVIGNPLAGALSGILPADDYIVTDNIFVPLGQTLTIEAGTILSFTGGKSFDIYGELHAIGTVNDSIIFSADSTVDPWNGLTFHPAITISEMSYCVVMFSQDVGISIDHCSPLIQNCQISNNVAPGGTGIYAINSGSTISNTLIQNNISTAGGGIRCDSCSNSLIIEDCVISDNGSDYGGGGIYLQSSHPQILNCVIENNSTSSFGSGGGLFLSFSNPVLYNCGIGGNSTLNDGGGIYMSNSNPEIRACVVNNNTASYEPFTNFGGGIVCINSSSPTIDSCEFRHNTGEWGGAIFCRYDSNPEISNCLIDSNSAIDNGYGGGIFSDGYSEYHLSNCTVSNNSAVVSGGGVYTYYSSPTIENSSITNDSAGWGGGAYFDSYSSATINNCQISQNYASYNGGGIFSDEYCQTTITNCDLLDNTAFYHGGAIEFYMSSGTVEFCLVSNNTAIYGTGGGIGCYYYSSPLIQNCLIIGNSANLGSGGGGIYLVGDSHPNIRNCTVSGNSAEYGRGGGVCAQCSDWELSNTIIEGNTGEGGIYFAETGSVTYCDLANNENGPFAGIIPPDLGVINTINANGDSCDLYRNIFLDPAFYALTGDSAYHLSDNSPCIDAGNTDAQYFDPEDPNNPGFALYPARGTLVNDMGAFGGPGAGGAVKVSPEEIPVSQLCTFKLHPNYPNPFNSSTIIRFELAKPGWVELKIFNVQGQEVARLVNGWNDPGLQEIRFNASQLPGGVYFAKLRTDYYQAIQKLLLIK